MSRVLVTGANGFLACNTINELISKGYSVRGMLRKTARLHSGHANLTPFYGNITEEKDVMEAARGCEIIIHIAAATGQSVAGYHIYEKVNVGGTRNIITASLEHKVRKVIYVSTANTFGYGTKSRPGDETLPMKYPFTRSGYAVSKSEAQSNVLDAFKGTGTSVTVVNPTFMTGPNDFKISSNRIILRALGKKVLFIPPGGKNFIHVKDAATGICNAIESGKNGECYLLANENLTFRDFYIKMAEVTGKKPFMVTIPKYLLLLAGCAGSMIRYFGVDTAVSYTNMQILSIGNYYSADKAVKNLRLPQTPIKIAIEEAVSWFLKEDR